MKKQGFLILLLLTFFYFSFIQKKNGKTKKISYINVDSAFQLIWKKQQLHKLNLFPEEVDALLNSDEKGESIGGGELSQEEFSDEVPIDSIWSTVSDYYAVWDSRKVNPYGIEGDKFKDTITIPLYSNSSTSWSSPIEETRITSGFGMRRYRWHYGTDLKLEIGDTVRTVFDGIIRMVNYNKKGYGNYVVVRHTNGLETLYGHLKKAEVEVGQTVKAGDFIGLGGNTGRSTGSHLHFEVRYQGNAIDPEYMFDFKRDTLISSKFTITPKYFDYLRELKKTRYHKIRRGDNLSTISKKYHIRITTICQLNRITKKTVLLPGRKLRIN